MPRYLLTASGPRPPYYSLAEHLWGAGCDFDSDGDSKEPDATDWTELTVILRSAPEQRVDIDPVDDQELLVLAIRSDCEELARRAAEFLQREAGGELASN